MTTTVYLLSMNDLGKHTGPHVYRNPLSPLHTHLVRLFKRLEIRKHMFKRPHDHDGISIVYE